MLPLTAAAADTARFPVRVGLKHGAIDATGKLVIEPQFDNELRFADGLARAGVGAKLGFIDADGKLMISPQVKVSIGQGEFAQEQALASLVDGDFAEGLAPFRLEGRYGYVDRSGAMAIPARFDKAEGFVDGMALVSAGGQYGGIDRGGQWLIEPKFSRPFRFSEGLAAVLVSGKGYGYIDRSGKWVIEPQYNYAYNFADGRARVQLKDGYGYIGRDGKLAIAPSAEFRIGADFHDGRAPVRVEGKGWGYLDTEGRLAVAPQFFSAEAYSEGLAAVAFGDFRDHRWGYVDKAGKPVGMAQYQKAEPFSEGRAAVLLPRRGWGYVDTRGELLIGPLAGVERAEPFRNGLARVWFSQRTDASGVWGYVNRDGKRVWKGE
ncbi:MAG TPA: WG repeat-containing protein [Solimonas sp.]|nr:WG repeat-containing protein [Solimonas sp.]